MVWPHPLTVRKEGEGYALPRDGDPAVSTKKPGGS